MKGFCRNGSALKASMAEEEAVGVGAVAAVELDYSTGISSEVSSSPHPAKDAGSGGLAAAGDQGERLARGQHGEEEEDDAELELGLSLGAKKVTSNSGAVRNAAGGGGAAPWGEYCRILTAKDFPSIVASRGSPISSSSSTASSSPSLGGGGGEGVARVGVGVAGIKRAAESVAPEAGSRAPSQVVGWPPIRAYRMNSLMNQSRDSSEENNKKNNGGNVHHDKPAGHSSSILRNGIKENGARKEHEKKRALGGSLFVKVNMDGMAIGRKVDLNAHHAYETLALALEDMFQNSSSNTIRTARDSSLLDGSSEFVLTYEDKDGDWMLVGDVPWGMFLSTVKRLRIMRTSDATGLGPRC